MSQEKQILNYLRAGNSLTPLEALHKFGCFRLGARIWDLRHSGYNIINEGEENYAKYRLEIKKDSRPSILAVDKSEGQSVLHLRQESNASGTLHFEGAQPIKI